MIENCKLISLPKISDTRGNLTFIEGTYHIPFEIKRVYYLHDLPENAMRGGHAHKALHQLIVAVSGSFDVHLRDGKNTQSFRLDDPSVGLYLCPMIWREIDSFFGNAVCMVLASNYYDENDYYRDYQQFNNDVMGNN